MLKHAYVITGGIGSGKSTVCSLLKLRGFEIIDADVIAKECFEKQSKTIEQYFHTLDRTEIAKEIFSHKEKKKWLEELLHPLIFGQINQKSATLDLLEYPYIVDIPLFFESQNYPKQEIKSVVVYAPLEIRLQRIIKRDRCGIDDAKQKIAHQMDLEKKKQMADFVIDNSLDLPHLQEQIDAFITYVKGSYGRIKI